MSQPVRDDIEIVILLEWVERHPQAEALRQRDFFLHRFTWMQIAVIVVRVARIVRHALRHQVTTVRGCINQHVIGLRRNAAVERNLERLVAALAIFERQVVAENNEAFRPPHHQVDDIR